MLVPVIRIGLSVAIIVASGFAGSTAFAQGLRIGVGSYAGGGGNLGGGLAGNLPNYGFGYGYGPSGYASGIYRPNAYGVGSYGTGAYGLGVDRYGYGTRGYRSGYGYGPSYGGPSYGYGFRGYGTDYGNRRHGGYGVRIDLGGYGLSRSGYPSTSTYSSGYRGYSTSPSVSAPRRDGSSTSSRVDPGTADLRPGMVLPDGATVISVDPIQ